MMINSKRKIVTILCFLFLFSYMGRTVFASSGEEYITITVDAEDDNDNLTYSLDSTDPESFSSSNTFTIPAGTSHTIYVKDEAGNITSQEYSPSTMLTSDINSEPAEYDVTYDPGIDNTDNTDNTTEAETQDINIDVEIGNKDYSSILDKNSKEPAEPGMGTAYEKTKTDGSDDGDKVFYTVTTAEGDTFYMVIDQTQNNDNVYLLNTVTRSDLKALAVDDGSEQEAAEEDNLLTALKNEKNDTSAVEEDSKSSKSSGASPQIIMMILVLIGGGLYYYLKVYKNKKEQQMDVMDAMNMEDFAPEPEEDEEAEFEMADEEKQAFLDNLINGDDENEEELLDADPDEYVNADGDDDNDNEIYATSHENDEEDDVVEEMSEEIMQDIASQVADFESDYDPELDGEED